MVTYSIYSGTYSTKTYNLIGDTSTDPTPILDLLKDNETGDVDIQDIRDTFLTLYSNTSFKETVASNSSIEYIGIDSGDTVYENKGTSASCIFLGKRSFSGTSSYDPSHDILSDEMLESDTDIFLYNTKSDTKQNTKTRITILCGKTFSQDIFPYIQSQYISGASSSLSLDLISYDSQGFVSFPRRNDTMEYDYIRKYYVSINDIKFPSIMELIFPIGGVVENKVLQMNASYNRLELVTFSYNLTSSTFGTSSDEFNIYGKEVYCNGTYSCNSLMFTDPRPCPISIGDIKTQSTFTSVPIETILKRIVYDYNPPTCNLSILSPYSSGYAEVGTSPNVYLRYTINKKTKNTLQSVLSYMIPSSYPPIENFDYQIITGTAKGVLITPISNTISSFKVSVSDGKKTSECSQSMKGVYPYFYGVSDLDEMTTAGLNNLSKIIDDKNDQDVDLIGKGNLYFIYDYTHGTVSEILNESDIDIISSFTFSYKNLSSPTGLWGSTKYMIYKYEGFSKESEVNYKFIF
jgi:hypothetical protein